MKKTKSLLILGTLGLLLLGCYPQGPEYIDDLDLVYTNHNADYDFASKGTYARPDEIIKITGDPNLDNDPETVPPQVANAIFDAFDTNMEDLGWTRVDPAVVEPDVVMLPATLETTTITYWYDYWYGWWGGYYPGYPGGGYYPGYPSYPVVTSYSTGTLMFIITDGEPLSEEEEGDHVIQWTFAANGVLTGSYDVNRVTKAIDQGFKQSPYLKSTN
jgi:hypothetical protein